MNIKNVCNSKNSFVMKKRITFFTILLLVAIHLKAQEAEIIFVDFEPDTVLNVGYQPKVIGIDFNNDSVPDVKMYWFQQSPGIYVGVGSCNLNVKVCYDVEEGDTISSQVDWNMGTPYPQLYEHYGFRLEKEGRYYYGWFRVYVILAERKICFDKFAFCTIPDYPLRWGQTSITAIGENETATSIAIHPNPTTGVVRIEGENATEVKVFNTLGQLVKIVQNTNEVGLESLPQGVYLLRVTLEGGKVFSDKVVKE